MHVVDMEFKVKGDRIDVDHGYALYGALSRLLPDMHLPAQATPSDAGHFSSLLGIHPINGQYCGNRMLELTAHSRLRLRIPAQAIPELLLLTGKGLELDGKTIAIGVPTIRELQPSPRLYSRLVTIKGYLTEEEFLVAAQEQLTQLKIKGEAYLVERFHEQSLEGKSQSLDEKGKYIRRTLTVADHEIVGFALRVDKLTAEESLDLQIYGLGGRRKMGCGIFISERD